MNNISKNSVKNSVIATVQSIRLFLWRRQTLYALALLLLLVPLIIQLSIIPSGSSSAETSYIQQADTITDIGSNSLSLPHKLASLVALEISPSTRVVRAVSIVFFGLSVVALYRVLRRWHGDKIAFFTAAMFASNAVALSIARLASPEVLLFGWASVISILLWIRHGKSRKFAPSTLIILSAGLLYVPGAPYFFALLFAVFNKKIIRVVKVLKNKVLILSGLAAILVVLPLVLSMVRDLDVLKEWFFIPSSIDWASIPRDILRIPSAFIYRAPDNPLINVGRLPVFDVAAGGLFLIGLYAYSRKIKLERTKIMVLTALLGIVIGALGQPQLRRTQMA